MNNVFKFTILTLSLYFSTTANAEINAQLNCAYKTDLYANNKLDFIQLPSLKATASMNDDTLIMIDFKTTTFNIKDDYLLILEPSYMKTGVVSPPELAWNPNGGDLYLKATLAKKLKDSKVAVGHNKTSSNQVSSPKELENLKVAQASKTHSVFLSIENTEYYTLLLNHTPHEMVEMKEQIKDLPVRVLVKCQYSQTNN